MNILIFQKLLLQFFLDFFYLPIWWYTKGFVHLLNGLKNLFDTANIQFSPKLWLKNIFVPMYGQYDWEGRIVSFFVRLGNVIIRSFVLLIWIVILIGMFLLWIFLPPFVLYMFFQPII
jgi:hypothetical protein